MSSLNTNQLLWNLSKTYQTQKSSISKAEIQAKINEIKYLSSQKSVSRLSIRKEIIHLEHQLQGIYEMEKKVITQKLHEQKKEKMLKEEITKLRQRLALAQDIEVQKKVERMSHMLGEYLVKERVKKDVQASTKKIKIFHKAKEHLSSAQRITLLQERIEALKETLESHQELEQQNPLQAKLLEQKINLLQDKLNMLLTPKTKSVEPTVIQHTILFNVPPVQKIEELSPQELQQIEQMLPLPPPPKMRI